MKHRRLRIEESDEVAVVHFVNCEIINEPTAQIVGQELFDLIESGKYRNLVLNFASVNLINSIMLGKLVGLYKRTKARDGEVKLCDLQPVVSETIYYTNLNNLFDVHPNQASALEAFAKKGRTVEESKSQGVGGDNGNPV